MNDEIRELTIDELDMVSGAECNSELHAVSFKQGTLLYGVKYCDNVNVPIPVVIWIPA